MKTKSLVRRFGSALTILGIAAFLWGCGQVPTAPMDDQQVTTPAGGDLTPQGGSDQWW
jgi:hypothetical protein